jgi:hypothetical protein
LQELNVLVVIKGTTHGFAAIICSQLLLAQSFMITEYQTKEFRFDMVGNKESPWLRTAKWTEFHLMLRGQLCIKFLLSKSKEYGYENKTVLKTHNRI